MNGDDRFLINWLLIAAAAVVAPLVWHLPAWVTAVAGCLLAWRYLATHHSWPLPGKLVRLIATGAFVLAVYKTYGTLLGREPGVALLTGLLGLKLWELRGTRDYVLALFLLCILMLSTFLYSQNALLAVYMVACVVLVVAALFRVQQPSSVRLRDRLRLAGEMTAKALPLMLVLYLLFPRVQGGLWGLPRDAYAGVTGLSAVMNPGIIARLSESTAVAFRVEPASALPPPPQRYWRALVLDHTDGRAWTGGDTNAANATASHAVGADVDYTVTLEPTDHTWLVALDRPVAIDIASLSANFTARTAAPIHARLRYRARSVVDAAAPNATPAELMRALELPPHVSARVRALAEQWREESGDAPGIAQAALRYFSRENFYYTLTPPPLGGDPVDEFLFDTRQGFCEHFAAAFATLMRVAGVPTRVVIGYQGGEVNPTGDYLIVRQSDAHAWDEIWVAGRGWIRVDPTAAVAPERIDLGYDAVRRLERSGLRPRELVADALLSAIRPTAIDRLWHRAGLLWDTTNRAWNGWVLDYNPERQRRLLAWLGFRTPSWVTLVATLFGGVVLVVLLLAAVMLGVRPRREPVQRAYELFCRKMARLGLDRAASEGPLAFAQRCAAVRPELAAQINSITRHYVEVRYGGRAVPARLLALQRQVRDLRTSA